VGRERRTLPDRRIGTPTGGSAAGRSRATVLGGTPTNRLAEDHCVPASEGSIAGIYYLLQESSGKRG